MPPPSMETHNLSSLSLTIPVTEPVCKEFTLLVKLSILPNLSKSLSLTATPLL